jgi:hypothetical protein
MCDARGMRYAAALRLLAVLLVVLASAGYAAATTSKDVAPFVYRFQVTAVTFSATFTKGSATATTKLHLSSRPKQKSLAWRGKKDYSPYNGVASVVLRLAGTASYAGLDDPACNVTVKLDGSRWNPTYAALIRVNARDRVVTRPMIRVSAGRFPMAATYPRRGSTCPDRALPWWDGGEGNRPLSVLRRAGFSFTASDRFQVEDGGVMKWTVTMTVRKVHYRPIG